MGNNGHHHQHAPTKGVDSRPSEKDDNEFAGAKLPTVLDELLEPRVGLSVKSQYELLKSQIAPGATDDELAYCLFQAKVRRLDPFLKQIYFSVQNKWNPDFKRYDRKIVIMNSIDGLRVIAVRTKEHTGTDEPEFVFGDDCNADNPKGIVCAKTSVYRKGYKFTGIAYWDEFAPYTDHGLGYMWKKMPAGQLAKCSEAQALRKGFPEELGGMFVPEEMEQATAKVPIEAMQITPPTDAQTKRFLELEALIKTGKTRREMVALSTVINRAKKTGQLTPEQISTLGDLYAMQRAQVPNEDAPGEKSGAPA